MRRGWWSRLPAKAFITRLLQASSLPPRLSLNTMVGMKGMPSAYATGARQLFIAGGSGSIGWPERPFISAVSLGAFGRGAIPTGAASISNGKNRQVEAFKTAR